MQRSALAWGLILVLFGGLLLLGRLGFLTFSVWSIIWPLVLIATGLSFLLGRADKPEALPAEVGPENVVMQLKGAESAEITLRPGPLGVVVDGTAPPDELLRGTFPGGLAYQAHDLGNGHIGLELQPSASDTSGAWLVSLNPSVPLSLRIRSASGRDVVELSATQVNDLDVMTGSGHMMVTLPSNAGQVQVKAATTSGVVDLRIPPDVAAFIQRADDSGGRLDVDADRFAPSGVAFKSDKYEEAENGAELLIAPGAGRISVG